MKSVRSIIVEKNGTLKESVIKDYDEDKMVKIYMNKYGIDNVRGGTYIQEKLSNNSKRFIINELRMANNLCLCCGANDHFAKTCIYKSLYTYFITKIKNLFL